MSSESKDRILYVVRDAQSQRWLELITETDALLLVEDGVYHTASELIQLNCPIYALESDANARAVSPKADLIDHAKWVTLSLQFSQTVRL